MQVVISLVLTLSFIGLTFGKLSPVFVWNAQSVAKPALIPIRTDEFRKIVTPLLAKKSLVVFLENDLSNEDFSCRNVDKSCYSYLQSAKDGTYYVGVNNSIEALRTSDSEYKEIFVDASGILSEPLDMETGKINFLKFEDKNQPTRASKLLLHDNIIASTASELGDNVFFMYVSEPSEITLKRQRRQASDNPQGYVFRQSSNLLLYYKSLTISQGESVTELEIKSMSVDLANNTAMSVTLSPANGSPLTFDVFLNAGYFFMKNVKYNNIKFLSSEVYAPTDFSYSCGNLTLINIPSENVPAYTLKWNYLQFQAPFGYTKDEHFPFGDAWHCVGFFTGGILSGLLIVVLLLTITFVGICWMMDINTMDRFDDPKGKTITISASE